MQPELSPREVGEAKPLLTGLADYFRAEVDPHKGDFIIAVSYFILSTMDTFVMLILGSLIIRAGDTVSPILALVAEDANKHQLYVTSIFSIICFGNSTGSIFFIWVHRLFNIRCRLVLCFLSAILLALVVSAATLIHAPTPCKDSGNEWRCLLPFWLFAFQSSGQVVITRALGFRGLVGFLLKTSHWSAFMFLLIESFVGFTWSYSNIGIENVLWSAALAKALVVIVSLFWKAPTSDPGNEKSKEPDSDDGEGTDGSDSSRKDSRSNSSSSSGSSSESSSTDSSDDSSSDHSSHDDLSDDDSSDHE